MLLKTENPVSCSNNQQGSEPNAMKRISSVSARLLCSRRVRKTRCIMDIRQQKGLQIAATKKLTQSGNRWFVPSQTGNRGESYVVKPDVRNPHCNCPDHELRQVKCKHIFAVEFVIQREFTFNEETQTETMTETVTVKQTNLAHKPSRRGDFLCSLPTFCADLPETRDRADRFEGGAR